MVMGYEPQLGAGVARGHVRRHEAWEERQNDTTDENKSSSSCTDRIYYWLILLDCIIVYQVLLFPAFTSMCNRFQT